MKEWRYSATVLDLGSGWRRVARFTPPVALPPRWKWPRCPLFRWPVKQRQKYLASASNRTWSLSSSLYQPIYCFRNTVDDASERCQFPTAHTTLSKLWLNTNQDITVSSLRCILKSFGCVEIHSNGAGLYTGLSFREVFRTRSVA
jgi:hypothetical protein